MQKVNIIFPSTFCLPKGLVPWGFLTKTLYAFLDCSIYATCPAHLSRLDLRFLIMLGEEYYACSSALCNFLHSLNLCSSLKVRDQVSQPDNTTSSIIFYTLCLNFHFLGNKTIPLPTEHSHSNPISRVLLQILLVDFFSFFDQPSN